MVSTTSQTSVIPLLDLRAQYRQIREEVMAAITRVAESQAFVLGAEVESLEHDLAGYCRADHAIGCASGSERVSPPRAAFRVRFRARKDAVVGHESSVRTYSGTHNRIASPDYRWQTRDVKQRAAKSTMRLFRKVANIRQSRKSRSICSTR